MIKKEQERKYEDKGKDQERKYKDLRKEMNIC